MASVRSTTALTDLRRATEIVRILVRHGFGYLVGKRVLAEVPEAAGFELSASGERLVELPVAERIKRCLEALGPTFVKLGQVLSTRADIVPESVASALQTLQDQAAPLPFDDVRGVVESELGAPLAELFPWFDPEPLATASIAQVHRARARRGEVEVEVVCKVQRPTVREVMRADLSLLYWLARVLEETVEEVSAYSPTAIVAQFEAAMEEEIDFVHERQNLERVRANFAKRPELLEAPEPFADLSTRRVLTMAYLDGVKITDVRDDPSYDKQALQTRLVEAAFKQVFEDGFFHGDPHPGNVLVLRDGRLGLIDHGLWGRLSADQQDALAQWLLAIALKSPSTLARLTLKIGEPPPGFDRLAYERDIRELMDRYVGVELSEVDSSAILTDSVEVVRRHRIRIPPSFAVLARATATLEGIVRHLYPELDFQRLILPYVQQLIFRKFDPTRVGPELAGLLLGLQDFVDQVPGHLNQLLLDLSAGRFRVSVQGEDLSELTDAVRVQGVRLMLAVLAGASMVAAAVASAGGAEGTWWTGGCGACGALAVLGLLLTFVFPRGVRKIRLSRWLVWRWTFGGRGAKGP